MKPSPQQIDEELNLARQELNSGKLEAADQRLGALLACHPESVPAWIGRAMVRISQGDHVGAVAPFMRALKLDPINGEALAWLTICRIQLGDGAAAEACCKRLIAIQPESDRAHFLMSNALTLQGRFDEALNAVERSLALKPMEPDYFAAKAQLLNRMNWTSQSIEFFRRALKIKPNPDLSIEFAEVLLEEGQVDEAIAHLAPHASDQNVPERAIRLLAQCFTEAQDFGRADDLWSRLESSALDLDSLVICRAQAEINAGRLDRAEYLLLNQIETNPFLIDAYALLARIRRMSVEDDGIVAKISDLLWEHWLSAVQQQDLNFALGKAYDDLGAYQKAMECFERGNQLAFEQSPACRKFNIDGWRSYADHLIQFFTRDRIASLTKEGLESNTPIFILGMIRSGTTLTEQILSRHSRVEAGGEKSFWPDHREEVFQSGQGQFDMVAGRNLGHKYLRNLTKGHSQASFITEKNPSNVFIAPILHCIYPQAKILQVRRTPIDNALSIWMTPMRTGLPFVHHREHIVQAFQEYQRLSRHLESVLPGGQFRSFRYNDLTSSPDATINGMLSFLSIEFESVCFHPEANSRTVRTPSSYQVRQPINTASQNRWKHYEPWLGSFAELLEMGFD